MSEEGAKYVSDERIVDTDGGQRTHRMSVVIPVKDEQQTLAQLVSEIRKSSLAGDKPYGVEIILVDDGSRDASWAIMQELVRQYPGDVRALKLRRNFGKAIALEAGFRIANGDVI